MAGTKTADFSGWATKAGLKCADGRTITPNAFAEQDGLQVPLVWQHLHNDPSNILGHAILYNRPEGVYCEAFFNESENAQKAKEAVRHKDINQLSIYANKLVEKAKQVLHGKIREVSLVLAGANPGALIDTVAIRHSDGVDEWTEEREDEAIIYTGLEFALEHADAASERTIEDVWNSMDEEQQKVVEYMVGAAVEAATEAAAQHDDTGADEPSEEDEDATGDDNNPGDDPGTETKGAPDPDSITDDNSDEGDLDNKEGTETEMKHNVFDQSDTKKDQGPTLSHSDIKGIFEKAKQLGSVKDAVEDYALKHGIEDIEVLFPDAQSVTDTPDWRKRRTEWVAGVIDGTRHTPFSRIKSMMADLTLDEARAKGYVKGNMKREQFFRVSKRVTTPQTVYKKQKLDRDDILDITSFDVVVWLKAELRVMLEEELARAVLIGDGRSVGDDDKIMEDHIRPIATDDDLYATTVYVNIDDASSDWEEVVDALVLQRRHYRGSGNPTFFTTEDALARMLLIKDSLGRRIYPTAQDLAAAIRCSSIVAVEVMDQDPTLVGIMVNLQDYTIGADRGGDLTMFDDFDIDFNQYKYLLETRCSGALTKYKSALVVRRAAGTAALAEPTAPTYNDATDTVTIPNDADTVYTRTDTGATLAGGSTVTLAAGESVTIHAEPAAGSYFATSENDWTFDNPA